MKKVVTKCFFVMNMATEKNIQMNEGVRFLKKLWWCVHGRV